VRRHHPDTFLHGAYVPLLASGDASDHVLAFRRGEDIVVAVTRWTIRLAENGWGNTVLPLPDGTWKDALTGVIADGPTSAAQLFADLPVVLLERHHD
jgi:(1->4)-alpha-D-glucan 1-alpha-D-glucosylmutase